jgi:hypothetical protein
MSQRALFYAVAGLYLWVALAVALAAGGLP